jgi:hypothetical protein
VSCVRSRRCPRRANRDLQETFLTSFSRAQGLHPQISTVTILSPEPYGNLLSRRSNKLRHALHAASCRILSASRTAYATRRTAEQGCSPPAPQNISSCPLMYCPQRMRAVLNVLPDPCTRPSPSRRSRLNAASRLAAISRKPPVLPVHACAGLPLSTPSS